jgi:hypothetical protein
MRLRRAAYQEGTAASGHTDGGRATIEGLQIATEDKWPEARRLEKEMVDMGRMDERSGTRMESGGVHTTQHSALLRNSVEA